MNPDDPVLEARGLTRYFGRKAAVLELNLRVPRGCVFAFLGRNGSGKSTTIRMLLGLLAPTRGSARVLGHDSAALPPEVRARVGYLAEDHPVYGWMTAGESERFQSRFYPHWNHDLFAAVVDHFAIDARTRAGQLSRGQRAGLSLALTLAPEPEVLVLDDPGMGLDPAARRALLEAMVYFTRRQDRTIFFSSHLLDDVERVADHLAVLDRSVLRACGSVEMFREHVRQLVARFPAPPPQPLPALPGLLQVTRIENDVELVVANPGAAARRQLEALGAAAVEEQPLSLEDALTAYVARGGERSSLFRNLGGPR